MKRVYLDNCCYNRPYDDQTQLRISLEAQAKLAIQRMIMDQELILATSYMTDYENGKNPFDIRRINIADFQYRYASVYVAATKDEEVNQMATEIERTGVKHKDACHVACAILAHCDCLLTTDDRLLKYHDERIEILDPVQFIRRKEAQ